MILKIVLFIFVYTTACSGHTPCEPNPCVQGKCVSNEDPSSFSCECFIGFAGLLCTDAVAQQHPCASLTQNPCSNRGTCVSTGQTSFKCVCQGSFTGSRCEIEVVPIASVRQAYDACRQNPCQNGGSCIPLSNPMVSPAYACVCQAGWTGQNCQTALQQRPPQQNDPCRPNPCQSGGTCVTIANPTVVPQFACICPAGYTGLTCQMTLRPPPQQNDPCRPNNPCQNGGTCLQLPNNQFGYACVCPAGYTGQSCQVLVQRQDACRPVNPCQNGGSCIQLPNSQLGFACVCPQGFTGQNCQVRLQPQPTQPPQQQDPCRFNNPCQNGGSCITLGNNLNTRPGYACVCRPGYTGQNCQIIVQQPTAPPQPQNDPCRPYNPCRNGGSCLVVPNGTIRPNFACVCPAGYTGQTCQTRVQQQPIQPPRPQYNPCGSNPCRNNGKCLQVSTTNSFVCVCPQGFTGQQCQTTIANPPQAHPQYHDPCRPYNPCQNGGSCLVVPNYNAYPRYACVCQPGYTGQNCQLLAQRQPPQVPPQQYQPCRSSPCRNGGTCIEIPNRNVNPPYACVCGPNWTGRNCEQYRQSVYPPQSGGVNLCNGNVCYNGGTCRTEFIGNNQYRVRCYCRPGYSGSRCQTPTQLQRGSDPCPAGLCVNGRCVAVREPQDPRSYCECDQGFTGPRCDRRDYCQSMSCHNGGSCYNIEDRGVCVCQAGFFGQQCQFAEHAVSQPKSACERQGCQNGGTCFSTDSTSLPICVCQRGFIGLKCEINICVQPKETGICSEMSQRFYFNPSTHECESFTYKGCKSNTNNFRTQSECSMTCSRK